MSKKILGDYDDGEEYEDDEDFFSGEYEFLNPRDNLRGNSSESSYSEERKEMLDEILRRGKDSKCAYLSEEGHCRIIRKKRDESPDFPFQPILKNLIIYCTEPLRTPSCKRHIK